MFDAALAAARFAARARSARTALPAAASRGVARPGKPATEAELASAAFAVDCGRNSGLALIADLEGFDALACVLAPTVRRPVVVRFAEGSSDAAAATVAG
jgi:hypothetical protein